MLSAKDLQHPGLAGFRIGKLLTRNPVFPQARPGSSLMIRQDKLPTLDAHVVHAQKAESGSAHVSTDVGTSGATME
jgi:hypothetical protein